MTWSGRQMMGNARAITGQGRSLAPRPLTGQALLVPYGEASGSERLLMRLMSGNRKVTFYGASASLRPLIETRKKYENGNLDECRRWGSKCRFAFA